MGGWAGSTASSATQCDDVALPLAAFVVCGHTRGIVLAVRVHTYFVCLSFFHHLPGPLQKTGPVRHAEVVGDKAAEAAAAKEDQALIV
ncbi:hypothetical protein D3C86_2004200 [compost metagenome]